MIDVVIPVLATPDDNEELRYALRSIDKNLEYSGVVWLIGDKPSWVTNVQHIPRPQSASDKLINVRKSVLEACRNPSITTRMIWSNDDFFVMKKLSVGKLNVHRLPIEELVQQWLAAAPRLGGHATTVYRTGEYLKKQGIERPLAFDSLHWPQVFDRGLLRTVLDECQRAKVKCYSTVYGNYHRKDTRSVPNSKRRSPETWPKLQVISSMDSEFEPGRPLGEYVRSKFPEPSRFEVT